MRDAVETRRVGICSHCAGDVILTKRPHGRLMIVREAACPCGATVIGVGLFQGLGKAFMTAVRG